MPTVSVIVPTYSESNDIVSGLSWAARESDVEIVVVDGPQVSRSRQARGVTVRMRRDVPLSDAEDWRPAWQVLSDEMPLAEAIDTVIDRPGMILLSSRQFLRLADDLGGLDAAWKWLERRASRADRPVAALLISAESAGRTLRVVGPQQWSARRLTDLVALSLGEIGEIDGPLGSTDFEAGAVSEKSSAPADAQPENKIPDASLAETDRELDEVRRRLSAELQAKHPELFDGSGRPRKGALEEAVRERTGKKRLSRADILDLLRKKPS